jgi:hypothetical protein
MFIMNLLYDWPTWLIVVGLLLVALLANELGFRFGRMRQDRDTELSKSVSTAMKGSIFALVALLLAFSFSATSGRYDMRQRLVLDQANAVGTAYLRAGLLAQPESGEIRDILRRYVDTRLEHFRAGFHTERANELKADVDKQMVQLWAGVEAANRWQPDAVRNSLIVPVANEVIDLSSTRAWVNRNHLPDPILVLLLGSVIISSVLLGHSSGQSNSRHPGLWLAFNLVFALVLYVVLDFDRPKRGMIMIDQTPLIELQRSFKQE